VNARTAAAARQRGFSIVELMVAVTIALVASLAIFQTYAASEERKRTTTSGSEGLQAGVFALASLERAVVNAGYNLMVVSDPGYTSPTRLITPGTGYSLSTTNPPRPEFHIGCNFTLGGTRYRLAPLMATDGGGGLASDVLTVFSGSSADVPLPVPAETGGLASGSTTIRLRSTWGFAVGDWVLVYEQSAALNVGTDRPRDCTLARVTALPGAPVISPADVVLDTPTPVTYDEPVVINLGRTPAFERYTVDAAGRLMVVDLLNGTPAQPVAENVVSMQVQLGIDVGNDDVIDEWINPPALESTLVNPVNPPPQNSVTNLPAPAGVRALHQVKGVRIGLLVRSPRMERPGASGNCTVTSAASLEVLPAVAGAAANRLPEMPGSGGIALSGDQRCFRYNTVVSMVPVRNALLNEM
jgi:type IV pilus assembly protein PilW